MRSSIYLYILISSFLFFLFACDGGDIDAKTYTFTDMDEISSEAWNEISNQNIFFGHQSVGNNIIKGIDLLQASNNHITLKVNETLKIEAPQQGQFMHSKIGQNSVPESKIDAFIEVIKDPSNQNLDIAFLKLCFVDIKADTDINALFAYYKQAVADIKKQHPNLRIIHFTVPLTELRITWKTKIKEILGNKNLWEYNHLINKNLYNDMLIKEYSGIDPIFDVASIESTYPDGSRNTFKRDGEIYYALISDYSSDGAHLNELGQKIVAEKLLLLLTNI